MIQTFFATLAGLHHKNYTVTLWVLKLDRKLVTIGVNSYNASKQEI